MDVAARDLVRRRADGRCESVAERGLGADLEFDHGADVTDWDSVPGWHNIGYPIAECRADGSFVISKPADTGGMIVPAVIAEQTLYQIGDPAAYFLPDVVADFSNVRLTQDGPDQVRVEGARGRPPTSQYKVSATYQDGYRAVATVSIVGPDAARKAEKTADALITRARMLFAQRGLPDFTATHVETLGAEASYGPNASGRASREVLLRVNVAHPSRDALEIFARELGAIPLSCAPGITGIYTGRPKPTPVVRLFTFFLDKADLGRPRIHVGDAPPVPIDVPLDGGYRPPQPNSEPPADGIPPGPTIDLPLIRLAYARSGDKGNSATVPIIAASRAFCPAPPRGNRGKDRRATRSSGRRPGPTVRGAAGIHALNFVIAEALGGGGMASARIDPQGKAYGQMALEMTIPVPATWVDPQAMQPRPVTATAP